MSEEKTILIVDDEEFNIHMLMELLEDKHDVLAAMDAKDALKILNEESVDLILLDIMMPEINGFELCQKIKNDEQLKDIPVIFITARTDDESLEKAYEVGGVDYITKPFRFSEVLSRVSSHLALAEKNRDLKSNLKENIVLLNQYKKAVDKGTLVSKMSLDGIITYVNDSFVHALGYTKENLLGHHFSMLFHSEISDSTIQGLWNTIESKQTWQGEIANVKLNGEDLIVRSSIMPILDSDGNTKEYISINQDVTDIYELQNEIIDTQKEVLHTMGTICESRSKETGNHIKRVAEYSRVLAKHVGLSENEIELLVSASPMHDIGKVAIPDSILNKPGKLTPEEYEVIKSHAELGYKMLCYSKRPLLKTASKVALEHHERWDGKGYPNGLKGESISIEGRIIAIADVFDALGSHRVYKNAWKDEDIFSYFKEEKEKQFDPRLVDIFFEYIDEFLDIRERFKDV